MAQLDTSVISDIGGSAPDVTGSIAKGLTLADLYDQNSLNKIKVSDAKQNQSDMTYAKQILQGKDLSKLDDQNEAVAQITKRSPQLGMQLARDFSSQRQDKSKENLDQLDYFKAKNEILGGDLLSLKAKHDEIPAQNPKATEQQIHDAMQKDVIEWVTRVSKQTLPNGQPLLNDQDKALIKQGLGQGYSTEWVNSMVQRSEQGRAQIAAKLKERDEERKEKATNASIEGAGRRGDQADRRIDQGDRKISDAERLQSAKAKLAEEGKFSQDDADALAGQYLAGDKSVMTGLGRGAQGAQNIIMVRHSIASQAKEQGMKPADIAARLAEYQGYVSEQRSLGTQQANVEMASSEAQQMIANARQASAAVPRGDVQWWTKLNQKSDAELKSDPALLSLKAATTAVINTWARAINPKGVATVADKDHGYALLNEAQGPDGYTAVLDRFQQETEASLAAPQSAKQRLHDAFLSGQTPTAAPAPGPASLQPTPGRGAPGPGAPAPMPGAGAGGGGTVLKFDAQGNPIT